jgi:ELWxxDGT repeat protein
MLKKTIFILAILLTNIFIIAQKVTIIEDLAPGKDDGCDKVIPIVSFKNKVYFSGSNGLSTDYYPYSTDGKSSSRLINSEIISTELFTVSGSLLYFSAYSGGRALYVTDGTSAGTKKVKTINNITHIFPYGTNSVLYTTQNFATNDYTLWSTNGTTSVNLGNFPFKSSYTYFFPYQNSVIIAEQSTNSDKFAPIITDGTLAGTKLLINFVSSVIKYEKILSVTSIKDKIFIEGFVKNANGNLFNRAYATNLTVSGTTEVDGNDFQRAYEIKNKIFVASREDIHYYDPSTNTLQNIVSDKDYFSLPVAGASYLFYHDKDNFVGRIDAITLASKIISKVSTGKFNYNPQLFSKGDSVYYSVDNNKGVEWNVINLKSGKDSLFTNIASNTSFSFVPSIATIGDLLVFPKQTDKEGMELWKFGNTPATPLTASIKINTPILCNKGFAVIEAVPANGKAPYTYKWNSPAIVSPTPLVPVGTYSVTITSSDGQTATATTTLTEPSAINLTTSSGNASFNQSNGTAKVSVTGGTPNYKYNWNTVPAQTTATATGLKIGTYTVTVTDANTCTVVTSVTVKSNVSANEIWEKYNCSVYPNPTTTQLNLKIENAVLQNSSIVLINSAGRIVYQQDFNSTEVSIDVSNFTRGIYTLKCKINQEEEAVSKVLIQD